MKTFYEWLLNEVEASPIDWDHRRSNEWEGYFSINGVDFQTTFWNYGRGPEWQVQFYQTDENHRMQFKDARRLSIIELTQLFKTIENGLIELFDSDLNVKKVKIHAEPISSERSEKVAQRKQRTGTTQSYSHSFDPGKTRVYMRMFQQGDLKRSGYTMTQEGENLIIDKPSITYAYRPDPRQLTLNL